MKEWMNEWMNESVYSLKLQCHFYEWEQLSWDLKGKIININGQQQKQKHVYYLSQIWLGFPLWYG